MLARIASRLRPLLPTTARRSDRSRDLVLAAVEGQREAGRQSVAAVDDAVRRLEAAVADLRREVAGLRAEAGASDARVQALQVALADLSGTAQQSGRTLERTQALVARTYEQAQGWPAQLERARRSPDYEAAFHGDPLVSVMVPTRDRCDLLIGRALASLLRQGYPHWEAVVVADECSDDTVERVRALDDPRIRLIVIEQRSVARPSDPQDAWRVGGVLPGNAAIEASTGAWLARLDDDDELDPDALEALVRRAQATRDELVYAKLRVLLPDGLATEVGAYPPRLGDMTFIGAIYHAALGVWRRDPNACLADEPADWNLARRMIEAGVRVGFLDRVVGTYHPSLALPDAHGWWSQRAARS